MNLELCKVDHNYYTDQLPSDSPIKASFTHHSKFSNYHTRHRFDPVIQYHNIKLSSIVEYHVKCIT